MSKINRRKWIQKNVLAASLLALGCRTNFDAVEQPLLTTIDNNTPLPLHWNENPYGPSPKAIQAVNNVMTKANRYPDDMVAELTEILAIKYAVKTENVLLTNGSTEILGLVGHQVGAEKGEILMPFPSFPTMAMFGMGSGATVKKVPLDNNNCIDLDQTLAAITDKTKVVFICNPNNPTSTEVDNAALKAFCRAVPKEVLVFVDEAYIEYAKLGAASSMIPLVPELSNLMVCRTFSKAYGLAGLRLGYAISNKTNIDALNSRYVGVGFATGWPALVAAKATLADTDFLTNGIQQNQAGKAIVYQAFEKWGVPFSESSTNFIYAESKRFVPDVQTKLKAENILITKWSDMTNHIRISISEPKHMRQFVEVVEQFLV